MLGVVVAVVMHPSLMVEVLVVLLVLMSLPPLAAETVVEAVVEVELRAIGGGSGAPQC